MASVEGLNRQKACRHGQMLYNVHDLCVGRSLDLYGEYCEGEVDVFRQVIQPGWIVVEVGANCGPLTVALARLVGPRGAVAAFEPQRVVFQLLCANVALNDLLNVFCQQLAVGSQQDTVIVPPVDYTQPGNFGGIAMNTHASGDHLAQCRLDDLNLPGCNFLKVDVEGMEQQVLEGAAELIARYRPVMYLENDHPGTADALVRYVDSLSYKMYWHQSWYFNPHNFFGNQENVFPNTVSMNMLCVHQSVPHDFGSLKPVELPPAGHSAP